MRAKKYKKLLEAKRKFKDYEKRFGRQRRKVTSKELCKYFNLSGFLFSEFKKERGLKPSEMKKSRASGHTYHLWDPSQIRKIGVLLHMDSRFLKILAELEDVIWPLPAPTSIKIAAPPQRKKPEITALSLLGSHETLRSFGAYMLDNNIFETEETVTIIPFQARQILEKFEEDVEDERDSEEMAEDVRFKIFWDVALLEGGSRVLEGITKEKDKKELSITFCVEKQ